LRLVFGLAGAAALLLAACASPPGPRSGTTLATAPAAAELAQTPFFPQTDYQCGPAALATVLAASGAPAAPEALAAEVYLPARRGSLQLELIAASRRHGRVPYVLAPTLDAVAAELADGRPVLVLQNLGLSWIPLWHYAVVIGLDPAQGAVVLRSGRDRRRQMPYARFLDSWVRAGHWALVTVAPDDLPASARPLPWLEAVATFEQLGQRALALQGYEAARQRWPEQSLVWQVLGNARYAAGDRHEARAAYRTAVRLQEDAAAYNNLAQTELELGCLQAARASLEQARGLPASPAVRATLEETARDLERAMPTAVCQP